MLLLLLLLLLWWWWLWWCGCAAVVVVVVVVVVVAAVAVVAVVAVGGGGDGCRCHEVYDLEGIFYIPMVIILLFFCLFDIDKEQRHVRHCISPCSSSLNKFPYCI